MKLCDAVLADPALTDVFDAVVFLEDLSAVGLVRAAVAAYLEGYAADPHIQALVRARRRYRAHLRLVEADA